MGPRREFARRFIEGIGKLTGKRLGGCCKKIGRLTQECRRLPDWRDLGLGLAYWSLRALAGIIKTIIPLVPQLAQPTPSLQTLLLVTNPLQVLLVSHTLSPQSPQSLPPPKQLAPGGRCPSEDPPVALWLYFEQDNSDTHPCHHEHPESDYPIVKLYRFAMSLVVSCHTTVGRGLEGGL
ncbi:hypothetical protein BHM03_00012903 [Ensete ventricosum]|nr:hypothetical protein BHM03_00012903 [Ensete ventricosum]